jgi:UMF1 family MFS transporter
VPRKTGRTELLAWCLYDFADSSFTTLIVTVAYGLYFRSVVAGHLGPRADFYWGASIAASMLLVALTSPVLGAVADLSGRKKVFLGWYAGICVLFTALLSTVGAGDLAAGMLLFILANVGYEGAHVFYNGFLPEIARHEEMGRISGYGWATGYLGGLAALVLAHPFTRAGLGPEGSGRYRLAFLVVAAFFLVFSLPIFLLLRERAPRGTAPPGGYLRAGLRRLGGTFRAVRALRDLFRFLLAFFVYNDGVATVIAFAAIYAMQVIGFTVPQVTLLFVLMQTTAFAGAFAAGLLVDRIGARPTILLTLVLWCAVVAGAYACTAVWAFYVVGIGASIGMGSTQTASRSLMGLLIPGGRNAEFFGFYALTGKVSAVLGPYIYGAVAAWAGNPRPAVLTMSVWFAVGAVLMLGVDVERGRASAARLGAGGWTPPVASYPGAWPHGTGPGRGGRMLTRLKADLGEAMRRGEATAVSTIRMLISQVQYARIELKRDLQDQDYLTLLQRAVKTRRESIEQYEKGGRKDLAEKERAEIAVVERYLPAGMSPEETAAAVEALLRDLGISEKKDLGRAMKEFMARHRGSVDGRAVNALIASRLK